MHSSRIMYTVGIGGKNYSLRHIPRPKINSNQTTQYMMESLNYIYSDSRTEPSAEMLFPTEFVFYNIVNSLKAICTDCMSKSDLRAGGSSKSSVAQNR